MLNRFRFITALLAIPAALFASDSEPLFWQFAPTPPMGWNSWDCYGTTVTDAEVKSNADYMASNMATAGWEYVVVDIQWYEPNGTGYWYPSNPQSNIDPYGRLWPVTNKHPSATNGLGFKPLADYVHGKGLKFGVHLMRGIPRRAYDQNTQVLGTAYHAQDIADTGSTCSWNPDMYGVDMTRPGAQEYYDSVYQLLAQWGVDFVKVDDLSRPYHQPEIEAIRQAIENSGRPMVLSTSPGETPLSAGEHVSQHANMWRISDDFWDQWQPLYDQFQRLHDWTPYRGPGHWPDGDMLPFGNIRTMEADHWTRFTTNEQRTVMTMWSIARSPLMMGGNLPNNDAFTLSLLTNQEVIAVNQASSNNHQLFRQNDTIAWTADVPESQARYVALVNANDLGFDEASAVFDSGVISRSTPGRSTNVVADITGATNLYLVVTDAGDYFGWDHADWGYARIVRSDGSSNRLADMNWVSATSGWNPPPKKNQSIDGNPLRINGTTIDYGIGTHAISVIEYELPAGFTSFESLAGLDDEINSTVPAVTTNATIRFMVFTNSPSGRTIEVAFASLGIDEPVVVRDLWLQQDLGTFTNSFKAQFAEHASGLFKFTPISALPPATPTGLLATAVSETQARLQWTDNATNETGYVVEHGTNGVWEVATNSLSPDSTNFLDSALTPETLWSFRVRAMNDGGSSGYSDVVSLMMPAGVGDGIPGWWRFKYFGDGLSAEGDAAATADPDGDSSSNLHEFLAETNPTNAASAFRIVSSSKDASDFELQFSSVAGRVYEVQRTDRPGGVWSVVAEDVPGNAGTTLVPLTGAASATQYFFRVRVKP